MKGGFIKLITPKKSSLFVVSGVFFGFVGFFFFLVIHTVDNEKITRKGCFIALSELLMGDCNIVSVIVIVKFNLSYTFHGIKNE